MRGLKRRDKRIFLLSDIFDLSGGQRCKDMRSFLIFLVALPQVIFGENSANTNDNDKYSVYNNNNNPSSSLYCNDLNPQGHLDFNMVILFSARVMRSLN